MAGVEIIAQLTRKNGANFPLAAAEDIIGAFATVASTAARDAIPTAILRTGAIVRIGNTSSYYEWSGSAWVSVSFGGGGGSGDVVGPASSVSGQLASFSGTTGKLLQDSGFSTTAVAPAAVTKAAAVAGTATSFSRSDHKHDVSTAAPGAVNLSGVSAAEGSATTLARSDHTHSLSGTLPVANGGTGLTALGTALYYLRVNAAGTALEYASVAAGVTAGNGLTGTTTFSVLAENSTIAVSASGIKRAAITGDVTIADGSNTAAITADSIVNADINTAAAIALSKLATQAALSVVANATNATAVPTAVAAASDGHVLRRSGTSLGFGLVPVTSVSPGTALQQIRTNAAGTALEHFSPPSPVDGGNLTNANVTKNISDGSQFTLPAGTLATSAKTLTLGTTGTPEDQETIEVIVYSQGQDFILKDGGAIGDNLFTVVAGTKRVLHAQWSAAAAAWRPAGKIRLT